MRRPRLPHSLSPVGLAIAGWAAFLLAGALFITIAWHVTLQTPLVKLDSAMATFLHDHASPGLTSFLFAVTQLNSTLGVSVYTAAFAAILARMRQWYWMLTLGLAVGGGMMLNVMLKHAYERHRPRFDDPLLTLTSYSFPSGHTAGSVLFYGTLAAFLVSRFTEPRKRIACVLGAVVMVVLVAFSRMYLGAHYFSDVLAAACSSTAWLVLCLASVHALVRRRMGEKFYEPRFLKFHWIALGLAIGASLAVAMLLPIDDWSARFQAWLEDMGLVQALLVFTAIYVVGSALMLPGWFFPIAAGVVFGVKWGLPVTLVAATLSCVVPFLITRHVLRGVVERRARRHEGFKSVDEAVRKEPWKVVALLRMSPILPSPMKSYFLGLTCVDVFTYAWASLVGMLPGLALKVYLGAAGRDALSGENSTMKWVVLGVGVAATIGVAIVTSRFAKRRLSFG
jgi:uncharacterized membrane protein YdjX (TVP38/TMEM64 family)/membrane-associated phospholipid phosphatase